MSSPKGSMTAPVSPSSTANQAEKLGTTEEGKSLSVPTRTPGHYEEDEEAPPAAAPAEEASSNNGNSLETIPTAPTPPEVGGEGLEREEGLNEHQGGPPKVQPKEKTASSGPKRKKELNPNFKDVQETGTWGTISRKEFYIVLAVGLLVVIGVVVGVVIAVTNNNNDDNDDTAVAGGPPTPSPTPAPTALSPQTKLVKAFEAMDTSDYTYLLQQELPTNVADYQGLTTTDATPQERAMEWLLFQDNDFHEVDQVGTRWALASIYYSLQGDDWISAEDWLSSEDVCDWEHISCTPLGDLLEVDLTGNNLVGTIPKELALLTTTQVLWLRENNLTGSIPNDMLGSMESLSILYLDNNHLNGTVEESIRSNNALTSLFVQANDLTGEWPIIFCPLRSPINTDSAISQFGLDCDEVVCALTECCGLLNCYYDEIDDR